MDKEGFRRYKGIIREAGHRTRHYQLRPDKLENHKFYVIVHVKVGMYRAIWNPFATQAAAELMKTIYFGDSEDYSVLDGMSAKKHRIKFLPRSKKFFERHRARLKKIKPYFPEHFIHLKVPKEYRKVKWRYHTKLKEQLLELNNYENFYLQSPRQVDQVS
jgi:hypothetical protein